MFRAHRQRTTPPVFCLGDARINSRCTTQGKQHIARFLAGFAGTKRYCSVVVASAAAQGLDPADGGRPRPTTSNSTTLSTSGSSSDKSKGKSSSDPKTASGSPQQPPAAGLGLKQYHYATFFSILVAGILFLAVLLYLQADIQIQQACFKVVRRLFKTVALRQVHGHRAC